VKRQRHDSIREILAGEKIVSQDELRRKLAARGFTVTQATLSRDIHELHIYKGQNGYAFPADAIEDDDVPDIDDTLRSFGMEVLQAKNLLVFITTTGSAQPVAAALDYEDWDEVVGTIAGDDTVLIICPDDLKAATLKTRIEEYLQ
jgi:transcriptional regulator of arginine metabolism